MSLSADFNAAKQKSTTAFGQIAETHPVLTCLAALASLIAALTVASQFLLH